MVVNMTNKLAMSYHYRVLQPDGVKIAQQSINRVKLHLTNTIITVIVN